MSLHVLTIIVNLLQTYSFSFIPDILGYRSPVGAWSTFDITRVMTFRLNLFKQPSLLHGYMSSQSPKQVLKQLEFIFLWPHYIIPYNYNNIEVFLWAIGTKTVLYKVSMGNP